MNFYDAMMFPLEKNFLAEKRMWLMKHVVGNVLEIGFGTGANLKFLDLTQIEHLTALDLKIEHNIPSSDKISFKVGTAEKMPFEENTFDTIIETLVLCSVENLDQTLSEIYRVLKPGGKFIYMDHVLPENDHAASLFKMVNPLWSKIAHGCQLIRMPSEHYDKHGLKQLETKRFGSGIFSYGIAEKAKV